MAIINGSEIADAPAKLKIPPAVYDVMVDGIPEQKANKSGEGEHIVLIMSIINNAEHEGKKLFEYLTISGSAKSKPFRDAQLHDVLRCFGFDLAGQINTDDLAGRVGKVVVKEELQVNKDTKETTLRTVISKYLPIGAAPEGTPAGASGADVASVMGSIES